jgi:hypothetical protein
VLSRDEWTSLFHSALERTQDILKVSGRNLASGSGIEMSILLPNTQRQHRTLHIQKDVLQYALC